MPTNPTRVVKSSTVLEGEEEKRNKSQRNDLRLLVKAIALVTIRIKPMQDLVIVEHVAA